MLKINNWNKNKTMFYADPIIALKTDLNCFFFFFVSNWKKRENIVRQDNCNGCNHMQWQHCNHQVCNNSRLQGTSCVNVNYCLVQITVSWFKMIWVFLFLFENLKKIIISMQFSKIWLYKGKEKLPHLRAMSARPKARKNKPFMLRMLNQ